MLLVTGTGRSGTHYTSELLKQLGYDVPHESVGKDGAASWKHIVSGTFVYIGKNREVEIDSTGFTRILHQVRHPLKVIASMQTFSDSTWQFMSEHIDLDPKSPVIPRAMNAWIQWNQLVEQKADWRFRIEDLKQNFPEFCEHAGIPVCDFPTIPHQSRDSRTERYKPLSFSDLEQADITLAQSVENLAQRYDYNDLRSFVPATAPKRSILKRLFRK